MLRTVITLHMWCHKLRYSLHTGCSHWHFKRYRNSKEEGLGELRRENMPWDSSYPGTHCLLQLLELLQQYKLLPCLHLLHDGWGTHMPWDSRSSGKALELGKLPMPHGQKQPFPFYCFQCMLLPVLYKWEYMWKICCYARFKSINLYTSFCKIKWLLIDSLNNEQYSNTSVQGICSSKEEHCMNKC